MSKSEKKLSVRIGRFSQNGSQILNDARVMPCYACQIRLAGNIILHIPPFCDKKFFILYDCVSQLNFIGHYRAIFHCIARSLLPVPIETLIIARAYSDVEVMRRRV